MAEEHGFESHEEHRLCVNNCGFSGSPATQNMCSNCYRAATVESTHRTTSSAMPMTTPSKLCNDVEDPVLMLAVPSHNYLMEDRATQPIAGSHHQITSSTMTTSTISTMGRCATCRKKIGLTGFKCRCGTTFCGIHRYPEKHGCGFDYKAVGRKTIAKENPIVKGEKLRYKI